MIYAKQTKNRLTDTSLFHSVTVYGFMFIGQVAHEEKIYLKKKVDHIKEGKKTCHFRFCHLKKDAL